MKPRLARQLAAAAAERGQAGLQRQRQTVEPIGPDRQVRVDGRVLIDFCSNDYLGLARLPMAVDAGLIGASASPLVSGYHPTHRELEAALADFCGFEAALLFASGYQANLAIGQALVARGQIALADRLNHASLNDGLRLAGARIRRYPHADAQAAAQAIDPKTAWIVSDAVFSMDGDLAPLVALAELGRAHDIPLWIDDAHGLGVLGPNGRGTLAALSLGPEQVDVLVGTFGKALGTAGAFVAGERALIDDLENSARGLIYSTAPSPALAAQTLANLRRIQTEPWRREQVHEHIRVFRAACRNHGVALSDSTTPIQILPVGDNRRALALAEGLNEAGFLVRAIRPPTVPAGTARLRITLSTSHQAPDIESLAAHLTRLLAATDQEEK